VLKWVTGHCNRAAVSRNRYGVEKTVDTPEHFKNLIEKIIDTEPISAPLTHINMIARFPGLVRTYQYKIKW
jgi:hypothetical protein